MIICPQCSAQVEEGSKYCSNCGLNLGYLQTQPNYNQNYQQPNQGFQQPNYNQNYQQPNQGFQQPNYNQNYQRPNQGFQQPNYNQNYQRPNQGFQQPNYNQNYQQPNYNMGPQVVYPKAGLGGRFFAYIIDGFITGLLFVPLLIIAFVMGLSLLYYDSAFLFYLLIILFALIPLSYAYLKDGIGKGQSLGKKMMGLMVVNLENNTPCSKGQSFLRNFIGGITFIFDCFIVLSAADGRKIADKVANTQVIEVKDYTGF